MLKIVASAALVSVLALAVVVPPSRGQTLQLPADDWRRVDTPEPYVESFEARTLKPGEVYPQRVTLYKLPMQANEQVGVIVAGGEYVQFLYVYPVKVTVRVMLERGESWIESVQTFHVPVGRPLPARWRLGQAASEEEHWELLAFYAPEVKATRFQLRQLLPS